MLRSTSFVLTHSEEGLRIKGISMDPGERGNAAAAEGMMTFEGNAEILQAIVREA